MNPVERDQGKDLNSEDVKEEFWTLTKAILAIEMGVESIQGYVILIYYILIKKKYAYIFFIIF